MTCEAITTDQVISDIFTNNHIDQSEEPVSLMIDRHEIEYIRDCAVFLKNALEFRPDMQELWENYCDREKDGDCGYTSLSGFPDWLNHQEKYRDMVRGFEGSSVSSCEISNTYNYENNLSQDMLYIYFEVDSDPHVLLSVHGGWDPRDSLYTDPRAFSLSDCFSIFIITDGSIRCENDRSHYWDTDDSHNWYYQGTAGFHAGRQLEKYPQVDCEALIEVLDMDSRNHLYTIPRSSWSASLDQLIAEYGQGCADMVSDCEDYSLNDAIFKLRAEYEDIDLTPDSKGNLTDDQLYSVFMSYVYKWLMEYQRSQAESTLIFPGMETLITNPQDTIRKRLATVNAKLDRVATFWTTIADAKSEPGALGFIPSDRDQKVLAMRDRLAKKVAQIESEIRDMEYKQAKFHEDRSVVITVDGRGLCPICGGMLTA